MLLPGESQGRGAWWAAVYGVAQSRTRLKRLSSSTEITIGLLFRIYDLNKSHPFMFVGNANNSAIHIKNYTHKCPLDGAGAGERVKISGELI